MKFISSSPLPTSPLLTTSRAGQLYFAFFISSQPGGQHSPAQPSPSTSLAWTSKDEQVAPPPGDLPPLRHRHCRLLGWDLSKFFTVSLWRTINFPQEMLTLIKMVWLTPWMTTMTMTEFLTLVSQLLPGIVLYFPPPLMSGVDLWPFPGPLGFGGEDNISGQQTPYFLNSKNVMKRFLTQHLTTLTWHQGINIFLSVPIWDIWRWPLLLLSPLGGTTVGP